MKHKPLASTVVAGSSSSFCLCQPAVFVGTWFCRSLKWPPPHPCLRSVGLIRRPRKERRPEFLWLEKEWAGQLSVTRWPAWQVILMSSLAIGHLWGCSAQRWVPASEAFGLCWETEFPISKCLSTCYVLGTGGCDRTPVPAPQGGDIQTEEAT